MATKSWKFIVDPAEGGMRLDQIVAIRTGLSRRKAREVLKLGGVQVHRKRVKVAGRMVPAGAEVVVAVDDALGAPPDVPIRVLFEDDFLLVVDKPAGMASQGTQASDLHDLTALLQRQRPGQRPLGQEGRGVLLRPPEGRQRIRRPLGEPIGQVGAQLRDHLAPLLRRQRGEAPLQVAQEGLRLAWQLAHRAPPMIRSSAAAWSRQASSIAWQAARPRLLSR